MPESLPRNILFITSDQQRWDMIGLLDPHICTPNLDRLAASGMLFTRAYTANPVCTPSRVSMLTGQYPCFSTNTTLTILTIRILLIFV